MDGAHALQRRQVGVLPRPHQIQQLVVGAHQMDVSDEEAVLVLDVCEQKLRDLALHEGHGIHHALGTNHVHLSRGEESRRAEVKVVLVARGPDDRVPRVLARVHARNDRHLRMPRDGVDCLALALVAEVGPGHEDALRLLNQGVEHFLLGRLAVPRRGLVVQLRNARHALDRLVNLRAVLNELPVVSLRDLQLGGVAYWVALGLPDRRPDRRGEGPREGCRARAEQTRAMASSDDILQHDAKKLLIPAHAPTAGKYAAQRPILR
mmetsp:Transcript_4600/g.10831  ORF Transcript_4600/g.10831 Transcript_4600/m.10831 type:complete len:264 (-) Transcript_4600:7-798(-)